MTQDPSETSSSPKNAEPNPTYQPPGTPGAPRRLPMTPQDKLELVKILKLAEEAGILKPDPSPPTP
jgi:hypothetical protein